MPVRLNKLLSSTGVASRRTADVLVSEGRVSVNGKTVTTLGTRVDPETDEIRVDGRRVKAPPAHAYFLLNKPRGVVSTRTDPERRTTVIDLLARAGVRGYFYPVGRLDYDSEGLIILTNDGDFANRVTHPRYALERTYEAEVVGVPDDRDLARLRQGIDLDGRRTRPAVVRLVRVRTTKHGPHAVLELTIAEGRNRQVRRMCDAVAHPVERLRRTHIGAIHDRRLGPGEIRRLTEREVRALTSVASVPPRATRA
ncbi:MAG TPA: pseudouridine synthase [Vicinamibacterales bacterium]|jgi:pseudouridine synthase|nr:pseudouridine synthase [Vicinamibacterales bacterium]